MYQNFFKITLTRKIFTNSNIKHSPIASCPPTRLPNLTYNLHVSILDEGQEGLVSYNLTAVLAWTQHG